MQQENPMQFNDPNALNDSNNFNDSHNGFNDPIIDLKNITFTYQGSQSPALRDVSFSVKEGECVLLCGLSGCGKTTVTRLLNGLVPNFYHGELTGELSVCGFQTGEPIEHLVPVVGSVFQNPKTQYFNTNTTAELAFPCENTGMPPETIRQRISNVSAAFGLEALLDRSIFRLSGGEKQKIAFGAACMLRPRLLVLDEPTSNLDHETSDELRTMLLSMKQAGVTIVLAEHRLAWARDFTDRFLYFENGTLSEEFTSEEFYRLPDRELARRGLRAGDLTVCRSILEQKKAWMQNAATDSVHGLVQDVFSSRGNDTLLLENLTIGYDRHHPVLHLHHVVLSSGEVIGLMGHNGIGKTTLIRTISGLIKPLSGQIQWNVNPCTRRDLKRRSFLVMQDVNYQLFSDSVREEVLLDTDDEAFCDQILEKLNLNDLSDRHPMSLSGGQKQRTAIACALVSHKPLIIMDEPTSGLDRYHMEQVGALLTELKKQGKIVIVITHDEELAAGWCDRILQLQDAE